MIKRNIVDEKISFVIKTAVEYKTDITFGEIKSVKDVLDSDIIYDISFKEEKSDGFGLMSEDDIRTYYVPTLTVIRKRPENDKEYFDRMESMEQIKKFQEEKERLEYLRLKAKFEG